MVISPSTSTLTSSNPRSPLSPSATHLASPTPLSSTRFSTPRFLTCSVSGNAAVSISTPRFFLVLLSLSLSAAYSYPPLSLKPLSLSSPPLPETTPKATTSDLLSLLGPNRRSSAINPLVARELQSCFKFLVPFAPNRSRMVRESRFSRTSSAITDAKKNPFSIKVGMAQMLRGDAILEVTAVDQAKLTEDAGACAISELRLSAGVAISARP